MKEVVVIGGGHNGLVAASLLAQAGLDVLLLEAREVLGGRCAPIQFHPGFAAPGLLDDTSTFRPRVCRELGLEEDGLKWRDDVGTLVATDGRRRLVLPGGDQEGLELEDYPDDLSAFQDWRQQWKSFREVIRGLLDGPPPPLSPQLGADLWQLGKHLLALRRLGKNEMLELLRILPMSVGDWLGEHFQSPLLKEALAFTAVMGGFFGPRAAGTAANLLGHVCCSGRSVAGGPAALVEALASSCRRSGVELRTGAQVKRIGIASGRVREVEITSGEVFSCSTILAACHPRTVFLELIRPSDLTLRLEDQIRSIRTRGTAARANLALSSPLKLPAGYPETIDGIRWGAGGPDALEQIFDAAKYHQISQELHLDLSLPSRSTPGLAPDGGEVLGAWLHTVPFRPDPDWNRKARARLTDSLIQKLEQLDPDIRHKIQAVQILTPCDLEREFGLTGGQIFHAERTLDQALMLRPAPALAGYATPICGLFVGGAACHPGGEISGMPGYLAARTILDRGRG